MMASGRWAVGALKLNFFPHLYASVLSFGGCRVRLSEGFHFACSGEGIINMVLELPVQVCASLLKPASGGRASGPSEPWDACLSAGC